LAGDDIAASARALRRVLDECGRFLRHYRDPSVLFADAPARPAKRSPETLTPPEERLRRDWGHEYKHELYEQTPRPRGRSNAKSRSPPPSPAAEELPTAFHALLGGALAQYGDLLARAPPLVQPGPGEPVSPREYWLAALDVFETGDGLPARSTPAGRRTEDWQMALAWGRALASLAADTLARRPPHDDEDEDERRGSPHAHAHAPDSLFGLIAARCPRATLTRRTVLARAGAGEILTLAADQFSRAILHMPRRPRTPHDSGDAYPFPPSAPGTGAPAGFSRARELLDIARAVRRVAERMGAPAERRRWVRWADGILGQVRAGRGAQAEGDAEDGMAAEVDAARGRCWMVVGREWAEGEGEGGGGEGEAKLRREALERAVGFLEQAMSSGDRRLGEESRGLLAEALRLLAELASSAEERERVLVRAHEVERGFEAKTQSREDRMDET
jgi:hypothetical protein